jgi:hypothetical protein
MTEAPESVTVDELTAALCAVEHPCGGRNDCASCRGKAISLLSHVMSLREPEYEPGETYRDAKGEDWRYEPSASAEKPGSWAECPWLKLGSAGVFSVGTPDRPLRKLVPLPTREDLVPVLVESIAHDVSGYEGQAQRVLKLLEGASDD